MRILIVNDDSISAPGIAVLARAASQFGEVTVVAPASQCSAMSQKLTLRESMGLEQVHDFPVPVRAAYRLEGTPVDCVKVALQYILEDKPDWILSGINHGYNVGYDIAYSGTLGAALEGARNDIPAMAFSIADQRHLPQVPEVLESVLRELLQQPEPKTVWNVNFPRLASQPLRGILRDRSAAPVSMFREAYQPQRQPDGRLLLTVSGIPTPDEEIPQGTDAWAVRSGYISIGRVKV